MSVRLSSNTGDKEVRRLKAYIIETVRIKSSIILSNSCTLDQLVRHAAKADVALYMYSSELVVP
uniref:Uncharacterized protein n=1 Tax=Pseudomonas phage Touem01 TaxID=3138548 RepID=A0AAU6W1X4_9VIRU